MRGDIIIKRVEAPNVTPVSLEGKAILGVIGRSLGKPILDELTGFNLPMSIIGMIDSHSHDYITATAEGCSGWYVNTTDDKLEYFISSSGGGVAADEDIEVVKEPTVTNMQGTYFTFASLASNYGVETKYYVWYDVDADGTTPAAPPGGHTGIEVDILSTDTNALIASKTKTAIEGVCGDVTITIEENNNPGVPELCVLNIVSDYLGAKDAATQGDTSFIVTINSAGIDNGSWDTNQERVLVKGERFFSVKDGYNYYYTGSSYIRENANRDILYPYELEEPLMEIVNMEYEDTINSIDNSYTPDYHFHVLDKSDSSILNPSMLYENDYHNNADISFSFANAPSLLPPIITDLDEVAVVSGGYAYGVTLYYAIASIDLDGYVSLPGAAQSITIRNADYGVRITWQHDIEFTSGYKIYRATRSDLKDAIEIAEITSAGTLMYDDDGTDTAWTSAINVLYQNSGSVGSDWGTYMLDTTDTNKFPNEYTFRTKHYDYAEIDTIVVDKTALAGGDYFTFSIVTAAGEDDYYVWFTLDAAGADPALVGPTGIQCDVLSTDTNPQMATKIKSAIDGAGIVPAPTVAIDSATVTITQALAGNVTAAADGAAATGFAFSHTDSADILLTKFPVGSGLMFYGWDSTIGGYGMQSSVYHVIYAYKIGSGSTSYVKVVVHQEIESAVYDYPANIDGVLIHPYFFEGSNSGASTDAQYFIPNSNNVPGAPGPYYHTADAWGASEQSLLMECEGEAGVSLETFNQYKNYEMIIVQVNESGAGTNIFTVVNNTNKIIEASFGAGNADGDAFNVRLKDETLGYAHTHDPAGGTKKFAIAIIKGNQPYTKGKASVKPPEASSVDINYYYKGIEYNTVKTFYTREEVTAEHGLGSELDNVARLVLSADSNNAPAMVTVVPSGDSWGDYKNAMQQLENTEDVQGIVVLYGYEASYNYYTIFQDIYAHCISMSDPTDGQRERRAITSLPNYYPNANYTTSDFTSFVTSLQATGSKGNRATVVIPDGLEVSINTWVGTDGSYTYNYTHTDPKGVDITNIVFAAAVFARYSGLRDLAESISEKEVVGFTFEKNPFSDGLKRSLINKGLTLVENRNDTATVYRGLFSCYPVSSIEDSLWEIGFVEDYMKGDLRRRLVALRGKKLVGARKATAFEIVNSALQSYLQDVLISGYSSIRVWTDETDPTQLNLFFKYTPLYSINKVYVEYDFSTTVSI